MTDSGPDKPLPMLATLGAGCLAYTLAHVGLVDMLGRVVPSLSRVGMEVACGVVAALAAVVTARGGVRGPWLGWVMGALSVPVTLRLLLVADSWGVATALAPVAGAVAAGFVLAGLHASSRPAPAGEPLVGRWADLSRSAHNADESLRRELAGRPLDVALRRGLEERSQKLLQSVEEMARSWQRLERSATPDMEKAIQRQVDDVTARQASSSDTVTRGEYQRTSESLSRQLESVQRIRRGAERALARAQRQVTVMETARLGVVAYAAQDASSQGDEAARLTALLDAASEELEVTAGALEEAETESSALLKT
jgi:hypothetical protein